MLPRRRLEKEAGQKNDARPKNDARTTRIFAKLFKRRARGRPKPAA